MKDTKFFLVLGDNCTYLPLDVGTILDVNVFNDQLEFNDKSRIRYYLKYTDIVSAKFEKKRNKLRIHFSVNGSYIHLYGNKRNWKNEKAKKMVEKLNEITPVKHMKEYDRFVRCFLLIFFRTKI